MSPGTNIAALVETTPALVFSDPAKADELFAHIEREIAAFVPDVETATGRKAIASLAYKVSRTKTAIDEAGADLIEDANKKVKSVNGERKRMRDRLDALRDQARQPLDAWEAAEEERKALCNSIINNLRNAGVVAFDDTSEKVIGRLSKLEAFEIDEAKFGDFTDTARDARKQSIAVLEAARDRLLQDEADRAELEQLRAETAERDRVAAAEAEERQAAERQAEYISAQIKHIIECGKGFIDGKTYPLVILRRELEEKVVIDETFGDRREEAQVALDEALALIAAAEEKAAQEAAAEADRREQEAADAARAETEAALRRQQEARDAEQARIEQEAADRAADQEHRSAVMRACKEAIMEAAGIGEDKAKKIVLAIAAGNVPRTTINF